MVDRRLQGRRLALRLTSPGLTRLYVDGHLVTGEEAGPSPEIPGDHRSGATITLTEGPHLIAVHYSYPAAAPFLPDGVGFHLTIADPSLHAEAAPGQWIVAVQGAIVAFPLFLFFLHIALYAFSPAAKENLFYAIEMAAFAVIVLRDTRTSLLPTDQLRTMIDQAGVGVPIVAIFFGLLTYYAIRATSIPRNWRVFAATGLAILAGSYIAPPIAQYGWMFYFAAMCIEVFRFERSGRAKARGEGRFFTIGLAVFGVTIILQILVNLQILPPIGGIAEVYIFGILASASGMSLYLARTLGQSRVVAVENDRKSEELARARELQLSMLPQELPAIEGLDIAAATRTAAEVGGDYYDFRHDGATLLVAFGDATGHGLAAGVVVTAAKALFESLDVTAPPSRLLAQCGQALRAMRLRSLRMALALARVSRVELVLASAAVPPALIHRSANGVVEETPARGLPLGTNLSAAYSDWRTALHSGDTILFASDGFAELANASGIQLGYVGVTDAFGAAARGASANAVLESLLTFAGSYRGARALDDDLTLVVIRVA